MKISIVAFFAFLAVTSTAFANIDDEISLLERRQIEKESSLENELFGLVMRYARPSMPKVNETSSSVQPKPSVALLKAMEIIKNKTVVANSTENSKSQANSTVANKTRAMTNKSKHSHSKMNSSAIGNKSKKVVPKIKSKALNNKTNSSVAETKAKTNQSKKIKVQNKSQKITNKSQINHSKPSNHQSPRNSSKVARPSNVSKPVHQKINKTHGHKNKTNAGVSNKTAKKINPKVNNTVSKIVSKNNHSKKNLSKPKQTQLKKNQSVRRVNATKEQVAKLQKVNASMKNVTKKNVSKKNTTNSTVRPSKVNHSMKKDMIKKDAVKKNSTKNKTKTVPVKVNTSKTNKTTVNVSKKNQSQKPIASKNKSKNISKQNPTKPMRRNIKDNVSALVSVSKMLSKYGATVNGTKLDSVSLQKVLTKIREYTQQGMAVWDIVSKLGYKSMAPLSKSTEIANAMRKGYRCIINSGKAWELATGSNRMGFVTIDTKTNNKVVVPFKRVVQARCFMKNATK